MTEGELYGRLNGNQMHYKELDDDLQPDDDTSSTTSERTSAVKEMIMRFERGLVMGLNAEDEDEYVEVRRNYVVNTPGTVNAIHAQLAQLFPETASQGRLSNISVNSILSGISEASLDSESSGIGSDRKSGTDFSSSDRRSLRVPGHRPAPPPPEPFDDASSIRSRSPTFNSESPTPKEFASPGNSPVVMRRSRQPPVIRRKSIADAQTHTADTLWTYGVRQIDLQSRFVRRGSITGTQEVEIVPSPVQTDSEDTNNDSTDYPSDTESVDQDPQEDAASTDLSTDTLINEGDGDVEDFGENPSPAISECFEDRINYDNISIKSISSFDRVPYQNYDSITVSSEEFGGEVCHAHNTEFLTVSAVNEWCISKSEEPVLIPAETKKEKYRRRLTERVKELLHTESVFVDKLEHIVKDYIPAMSRTDTPAALKGLRFDIFANIERIYRFHSEELLPGMKACEADLRKLGQCFRQYEQKFNMYVIYSRNNKRSNRLVYEHKKFFQEIQLELGDRLDLSSYLLEPVQRIPRYKLFLDDLVKTYTNYENETCESDSRISKLSVDSDETGGSNGESSSDCGETPLHSLKQAKQMIESLLTTVDDIIALENIRDCPINLLNQGKLLRQQEFLTTDITRRRQHMRVFLFEKVVLLTVVYRKQLTVEIFLYRDHIPVDDLGITPKEHDRLKFTIWYKKRNLKSYKLETNDPAVRTAWVDEVMALLWKQAMHKKEMLLRSRSQRNSIVSTSSQDETVDSGKRPDDKFKSLRGVPGEVKRAARRLSGGEPEEVRRTTWYCE